MTTSSPSPMSPIDPIAEPAPQWAIIELMGHVRTGGRISKDTQLGTALLRVDVPQRDGVFISQLVNPSSIYRITMCDERMARAAAIAGESTPMEIWEARDVLKQLPAPEAEIPQGQLDAHPDNNDDQFSGYDEEAQ